MKRRFRILAMLFTFALCGAVLAGCGGNPPGKQPSGNDEIDMNDFPLYNEQYDTMSYSKEEYEAKMTQPYWLGNVIYNELALPVQYENGQAYANLLYSPLKVVSVLDQTLKVTYTEGVDYTVDAENGRLLIPEGSSIPLLNEKVITGTAEEIKAAVPAGYEYTTGMPDHVNLYTITDFGMGPMVYTESPLFYGKYLSVTYAYDVRDLPEDIFTEYDVTLLTGLRAKLQAKEDISLVVLGDSISAGNSSTLDGLYGAEPKTPCYAKQLAAEIERVYGVNVTLTNSAKGGTMSEWPLTPEGLGAMNNAKAALPDLCVIAYGMNDQSANVSAISYRDNIKALIETIKTVSPDCNFILVNSFPCNPRYETSMGRFDEYRNMLNKIVEESGNNGTVIAVDMQKVGKYFMERKYYCEISSSNINHPNDFMHRVYAMNLMNVISDYKG